MDALTDILNTLRLSSSLYFRTELTSPWGVEVPNKDCVARFHICYSRSVLAAGGG